MIYNVAVYQSVLVNIICFFSSRTILYNVNENEIVYTMLLVCS